VIGRRDLLVRTGRLLGGAALVAVSAADPAARSGAAQAFDDWEAVRAQFDLSADLAHLGGLYLASHPAPVREAIERHRRALDADPVGYLQEHGARLELGVLRAAAAYLGADVGDIALTDSTTMGLGLLYGGLSIRSDQEIVTTSHDFFATHEPLRTLAARTGAGLKEVELYRAPQDARADAIVASISRALTDRTRIVAVTWVHSGTGVKLPIGRIAEAVGQANRGRDPSDLALLCVDGAHGLGVEDATVAELGCDFLVASGHKWLCGPRGTGLVWGHPAAWPAATATIPSFSDRRRPGGAFTPGGFHSFEHRWALREAFEFHSAIGKGRVQGRVHELARQLKEGLAATARVGLHTPMAEELSAGIVCFDVEGLAPPAVVRGLRQRGVVATVTPYARQHARLAAGVFNRPEEVEAALGAIRELAG
jgi:selenocysteine lyase/cysteine desulfurase